MHQANKKKSITNGNVISLDLAKMIFHLLSFSAVGEHKKAGYISLQTF